MKPIRFETEIKAPASVVWSYLRDPEKFEEWMLNVKSFEKLNDITGVGERTRMGIQEGRRTTIYEGEVIGYEPGRLCRMRMVGGCGKEPMTMVQEFELEDLGSSTILRQSFECETEMKGLLKLLAPLGSFFAKMMMKKMTKRLDAACTGPTAQPA